MKNLIKLCIVVVFLAFGTTSFAQVFGLKGGMNLSNMLAKDDDDTYSDDFKMNPGFHVGPTIEFPISDMFSVESGLLFSTKGTKMNEEETYMGETYSYKSKINLYYLDIPLTAKLYFGGGNTKFFAAFGPYVGMGLSGKAYSEYTENGQTEKDEEDIHFGSDDEEDELKRLDYGITAGVGIALKAFEIGVTYNYGLANLSNVSEDGYQLSHRVIGIALGYKFGKKAGQQ